jgi:DNA repair protein SbcC/Rad50
MKLLKAHLKNVKSYGDAVPEIVFAPGSNFLSGQNGSGKTTIIEAIGYALFGVMPTRKEDFIRRGAKSGAITVWFEDGGEEFRVVRKFGATDAWVVYCKDEVSIEKRDDVQKFLGERFKARDSEQLKNAFANMIGVPQGMFTSVFKMTAGDRKKIFDGIIDVDVYSRTAAERAGVKNQIVVKQIADLKQRLAVAQGYVEEHKEDPVQLAEVEARRKEVDVQIQAWTARRSVVLARKKALDVAKAAIDVLDQELRALEIKSQGAESARVEAEREAARARGAAKACADNLVGHQAYLKAEKALVELEQARERRDALAKQKQALEKQIAADEEAIASMDGEIGKKRIAEKAAVGEVEASDKAHTSQAAAAKQALAEAGKASLAREKAAEVLETARKRELEFVARLEKAKKAVETALDYHEESERLEKELSGTGEVEKLAKGASAARTKEKGLNDRLSSIETEIKSHQHHKKELADLTCPFIQERCDRVKPAVFDGRIGELREKEKVLKKEAHAASEAVEVADRAEKRFEALKAKREEKKRAETSARREREKARTAMADWTPSWGKYPECSAEGLNLKLFEQYAADWAAALNKQGLELKALAKLEKESAQSAAGVRSKADAGLKALEGDRKRLDEIRKDIKAREKAASERRGRLKTSTSQKAVLEKGLTAFVKLDESIVRVRAEMGERRSAHQAFVTSEPVARELARWEQQAKGLHERIEALKQRRELAGKERGEAATRYDAAEAARVVEELEGLVGKLAAAEEERRNLEGRRSELEKNVARLRQAAAEAATAEGGRKRLERFQRVLEDIWKMLRELGPRVSKRLVDGIAARANQIFGVLHDAPGRLAFEKDYEVRFRQGESDLPFASLSGGEQMSAALSIQMAMARDFAGSKFCIFDEPTVHLDTARRGRLPAAIRSAAQDAGFAQVFIVSHDDTFGPHVDHEIQLRKSAGVGTEVVG